MNMSTNEFSTKLRYFRAKIRPLLKPVVWIPALLVLPAGYFLAEYVTSPEAISFWEGLQTEQEEVFSEVEASPTTAEKSKDQSKQQNPLSADQKLQDQLRITNSQAALKNGKNAPAPNPSQKLPELGQSGGLDSLLLPAGTSYNPNLGTNVLSGNKQLSPNTQSSTIVPVNPLQAAMEKYSPSSSGGMGVSNAGSPSSNVGVTGTVPSSANPNGASYLEAATGIPTVPVSPPVMPTMTNSVSNTGTTMGAQPNSYSYLTGGTQPTTVNQGVANPMPANPVPANPVPVVQIVSPALQNSGTFVENQGNGTVTQPSVSVPPQSTPPLNQVPLTPVPLTPVPIAPVNNYGPSAVTGSSPSGMPANVGNYGQGFYPTNPSAGVMQPVMPAVGGYGSATYPNVPTGTVNPGYPNPGVQPGVSSQPNSLPSAIGGGNINTFSNPTGSQ